MDFIAGYFGGLIGTVFSHPMDTVRIWTQTNKGSILENTHNIYKRGGLRQFYKGFYPPLLSISLEKSIVFGVYSSIYNLNIIGNKHANILFSGYISGLSASTFVAPLEAIKIEHQKSKHGTLHDKALKLYKNGRLYSSIVPTLFREPPGFAIYFYTYSRLNEYTLSNNEIINSFVYGSIAGCTSWLFIYPADVVKTRIQLSNKPIIQTINECINKRLLYKGFSLSIARAIPLHGGAFLGFTIVKKFEKDFITH